MVKETWTSSRLKAYQTCPMKEALRYRQKLAPISTKKSLAIGTAVHKGIEMWDEDAGIEALNLPYPTSQEEADEQEIARVTVLALLRGYFKTYEPFEAHMPELSFRLPMTTGKQYSRKYDIAGKIDDVATINGQNWIVEYKTASKLDASYFDRLYVDSQITMYMAASKRLGLEPQGVLYRVLRKPQIRRGKTESIEQFLNRLEANIGARPEFYFMQRRLYRGSNDLAEFERMIYQESKHSDLMYKQGRCYKHSTACSVYGACEYLPLCMGEAGAEAMYETREPHEELKGE